MAIVQGQVEAISRKKVGNGFAYSFKVGDGWYRHGFDKPKFDKGHIVRFDDTPGKYDVIDTSTLQFKAGPPLPNTSSASSVAQSTGGNSKGGENWEARQKYWDDKDKRDVVKDVQYSYRSAFHMAAELVQFGVDKELITLTKTKPFDKMLTLIDGLAADIHDKFASVGETDKAADMVEPVDDKDEVTSNAPDDDPADEGDWGYLEDKDAWMD